MSRAGVSGSAGKSTKLALAVGYLVLAVGIVAAYRQPADGYELSIYSSTPLAFWAALAVAVLVAVGVVGWSDGHLGSALTLIGGATIAFAGLPLIRGYHFAGRADSLNHLGWVRGLAVEGDPLGLLYPGTHLIAASFSNVAGVGVPWAMSLVVWLFFVTFVLAVPLCVWVLVPDRKALVVGVLSGALFLPINNVSTHPHFHPYSLALLFTPLVLYLTLTHLVDGDPTVGATRGLSDGGQVTGSATSGGLWLFGSLLPSVDRVETTFLLPITTTAIILFHPQMALNLVILLGGVAAFQQVVRWVRPGTPLGSYRHLGVQTAFAMVVFVTWSRTYQGEFSRTMSTFVESILGFLVGSAEATPRVGSQTGSASDIGVSVWELFVKLFAVETGYVILTVFVVVLALAGLRLRPAGASTRRGSRRVGRDLVVLGTAGAAVLLPFLALHMVGSISTYLFRHVGFTTMLATILGAVGIRWLWPLFGRLAGRSRRLARVGRSTAIVVTVLVVALSLAAVFPSPFVYLPGNHVPEAEMNGYERSFAAQSPGGPVYFAAVRHTTDRYEQALYAAESAPWELQVTPNVKKAPPVPESAMLGNLPAHYANHPEPILRRDMYLIVAEADRQREVRAYDELRYSAASFEGPEAQRDVGRVRDNGEVTLYFVDVPIDESETGQGADAQ